MPAVAGVGDEISCGDTEGHGSPNVFVNGIPVVRVGVDATTGHDCYPPTIITSGSPTVFVNSIPIVRVGDPIDPHCCTHPPHDCHGGTDSVGSPNVFADS